jgi:uncharacterized membrane protein
MLRIEYVYWLIGAFLAICAWRDLAARRWTMAAFWAVIACAFLFGDAIKQATANGMRWPAQVMGAGVIALGLLAAAARPFRSASATADTGTTPIGPAQVTPQNTPREESSLGNQLFLPALTIPVATLVLVLLAPYLSVYGARVIDPTQPTLVALGLACVIAFVAALRTTRAPAGQGFAEGHRLLDAVGSVALLPMLLATLGSVFAATGVGDTIAAIATTFIPVDERYACLAAFALGMVVFTMVMGNAFAAFPVMMAGIGLPLLVAKHGAVPAALGSIGMLTGYCGTLLTPMAANFNIVPAVLLELRDQYAVIRAQVPTALVLLTVNFVLMMLLVFR